jgi:hypothetical protein
LNLKRDLHLFRDWKFHEDDFEILSEIINRLWLKNWNLKITDLNLIHRNQIKIVEFIQE